MLDLCANEELKDYLQVAFYTGARPGEILALKWSDLDFQNNTIHITRRISQKGEITTPKTRSSKRKIEMLEPAKQAFLRLRKGKPQDSFIFRQKAKGRIDFRRRWLALLKKSPASPAQTL